MTRRVNGFTFAQVYRRIYTLMRIKGFESSEVDLHLHRDHMYLYANGVCGVLKWDEGIEDAVFAYQLKKQWETAFNPNPKTKCTYLGLGDEVDPLYKYAQLWTTDSRESTKKVIRYLILDKGEIGIISYGPSIYYGGKTNHLDRFIPNLALGGVLKSISVWKHGDKSKDATVYTVANQRRLVQYN